MLNVEAFLAYRDTRPEFDSIKSDEKTGVPSILFDDGVFVFDSKEAVEKYKR